MTATIAERYVRAAHGVNLFKAGFIDAYFGHPAWTKPFSSNLHDLGSELEQLQNDVSTLGAPTRRDYLKVQIRAMQTMVKLKRGDAISFLEEVRGLFDIEPIRKTESDFEAAHQTLEALLPGSGTLHERRQKARDKYKLDPNRLGNVIDVISLELRQRSKKLFNLPDLETCEYALVQNKPWGGYNWYLGSGRSRIDVNTDLPKFLTDLPDLVAHESYPGHHSEHVIKEQNLVVGNNWLEFGIQLLDSPECVLAEGIATSALEVVMDNSELIQWVSEELAAIANLNLSLEEVQKTYQIANAMASLTYVAGNAALMLFEEQVPESSILEYLQHFQLSTKDEAKKRLEFIKYARGYVYTYSKGYDMLKPLLAGSDKVTWFQRLLLEPVTPSQLKSWALDSRETKL